MLELWKAINGYEGVYEVSNMGNVRRDGKKLKLQTRRRDGYIEVQLYKHNIAASQKVHRLVAEAFLPNPNGLPVVNHKDENPSNNRADNLEWCTQKYNCEYGTRNRKISKRHSCAVEQIKEGVVVKVWESTREAEKAGYNHGSISLCCNGKASHHKGFQWRYRE